MRSKQCLLNAERALREAERALNPHMKKAFLEIDRLFSRLAAMARVDEARGVDRPVLERGQEAAGVPNNACGPAQALKVGSAPLPAFVLRTTKKTALSLHEEN
jgi:hypothetical protein